MSMLNHYILFAQIVMTLMWIGFLSFYSAFLMKEWDNLVRWERAMFFIAIGFCTYGLCSL